MDKDYSHLDNKTVLYIDLEHFRVGKVVCCDYNVGIVVVDLYNNNEYYICLNGPSSPLFKYYTYLNSKSYPEIFKSILSHIESGTILANDLAKIAEKYTPYAQGNISSSGCPYNQ